MKTERIPKIVLTGGPCAGKTTGLSILMQKLPEFGVSPLLVPEVATLVLGGGIKIGDVIKDPKLYQRFQREILMTQIVLESCFENFARLESDKRRILLCDRGAMDGAAYTDQDSWQHILSAEGLTRTWLRDERYDAVIHLVTAAQDAQDFYNFDNPARFETPDEARKRDAATLAAWTGHPKLRIVSNTKTVAGERKVLGFDAKMEWLVREVCHVLGIPAPLQISRKFLINNLIDLPVAQTVFRIKQDYLVSGSDVERRVRARTEIIGDPKIDAASKPLYTYAEKKRLRSSVWHKVERMVDHRDYTELLRDKNPRLSTIIKTRHAFVYGGQYFQLDEFVSPRFMHVLEVELTDEQTELSLPSFIDVVAEVTNHEGYSNAAIAAGL